MRSRFATTHHPDVQCAEGPCVPKHDVLERLSRAFSAVIDWLRAGYPDEAPRTGYSPLLALNGPLALTPRQKRRVVKELEGQPNDTTTIEIVITKATGRLPTPGQTSMISRELNDRTPPL